MKPLTAEEIAHREKTRPRPYDLSDPDELNRLLSETIGYARVSLYKKDGTDLEGRRYAYEALDRAFKAGLRLCLPQP